MSDAERLPRPRPDAAVCLGTLTASAAPPTLSDDDIRRSFADAGSSFAPARLSPDTARPGGALCVVVPDQTRYAAVERVLPPFLDAFRREGGRIADVFAVVATGIHRAPRPDELRRILGPEVSAALDGRVWSHDPDDEAMLVPVGRTARGHAVRINRRAAEADRLVLFGAASYHYHAGFGGGRKCLVPGLADRATIAHTHSLSLDPEADRMHPAVEPGRLDGNPVADELMAAARLHPPDFTVNTVLDPGHRLIGLFTGEMDAAHRRACALVTRVYGVNIPAPADIVIADAGDAPDWIQAHKALFNAHRAMRPGGCVVLLARCPEGLGNERFRHWLRQRDLPALFRELRRTSEVNGQTALSTQLRGAGAVLVTDLSPADRADLNIETAPDMEQAIALALRRVTPSCRGLPTFYLMPHARHTVPFAPHHSGPHVTVDE